MCERSRPDEKGIETFPWIFKEAHVAELCERSRPDEKGIETLMFDEPHPLLKTGERSRPDEKGD